MNGRSFRAISPKLGLDISTLSKIKNEDGGIGIDVLLRLRDAWQMSLDEILGLPPLTKIEAPPATAAADPWPRRADAARFAMTKGIPAHVIESVRARFSDALFSNRTRQWWGDRFVEAHKAFLQDQEQIRRVVSERDAAPAAPDASRGRTRRAV